MDRNPISLVFHNVYLTHKIFGYIKEINKSLHYFTYDFYYSPLDLIIKNNNKQFLITRLKLYEKYFINSNNNNNNNNNLQYDSDKFKYYLEFNNLESDILFQWKEFDVEILELMERLFPGVIEYKNVHLKYAINNANVELFKKIEKKVQFIQIFDTDISFNINKCSNKEIIEMYDYLTNKYPFQTNQQTIQRILKSIANESKSEELFEFFLKETEIKYTFKDYNFKLLFIEALSSNNLEIIKLILSKMDQKETIEESDSSSLEQYITIYNYKIFKSEFMEISTDYLFNTKLIDFVEQIYEFSNIELSKKSLYIHIKSEEMAKFVFSKNYPIQKLHFTDQCLNDDLSNTDIFKDKKISWIPTKLNHQKYAYMKRVGTVIGYYNRMIGNYFDKIQKKSKGLSSETFDIINEIGKKYTTWASTQIFNSLEFRYNKKKVHLLLSNIVDLSDWDDLSKPEPFVVDFEKRKKFLKEISQVPLYIETLIEYLSKFQNSINLFHKFKFNPHINLNINQHNLMKCIETYGLSNYVKDHFIQKKLDKKNIGYIFYRSIIEKVNQKLILFLIQDDLVILDIKSIMEKSILHENTFIIDLILSIGNFKNFNFYNQILKQKTQHSKYQQNFYSHHLNSFSDYLNLVHHLIIYYSYINNRFEMIKYLLDQNYKSNNNNSNNNNYLSDFIIPIHLLNDQSILFLKNINLFSGYNKSYYINDSNIIQSNDNLVLNF
ncbi:hypothetical protein DICPUDRAFT_80348 [Dictyostelium purpureum]|uniref:Uncharacterized protein n=1 Tax=Dictyostelium purpureum TaxID=5786 RepID=F0ZQ84_DICPU|nr:uncharacterized protein DICPUDRAFT_80348 [Dictyostelium purpureum]EGC33894.1 hypothetical protein DICPUDRAFT_80348 [Dictyostelium purpureum]|eukprot:XP_003289577.1 hypothetical protein DICPUDRAFT_80348 [Dictyostelium purpureum]